MQMELYADYFFRDLNAPSGSPSKAASSTLASTFPKNSSHFSTKKSRWTTFCIFPFNFCSLGKRTWFWEESDYWVWLEIRCCHFWLEQCKFLWAFAQMFEYKQLQSHFWQDFIACQRTSCQHATSHWNWCVHLQNWSYFKPPLAFCFLPGFGLQQDVAHPFFLWLRAYTYARSSPDCSKWRHCGV